uniref:Uncharacterized protein n=1 Tax=Anopheles christyi TaxID=43041 RepID=A0A182KJ40_9DIPT
MQRRWFSSTEAVPRSRKCVPSSSGTISVSSDIIMLHRAEFLITIGISMNRFSYPTFRLREETAGRLLRVVNHHHRLLDARLVVIL